MHSDANHGAGLADGAPAAGLGRFCDECSVVREADHRIANHLSMLSAFLRLRSADLMHDPAGPSGAAALLLIQSVGAQIDAIARVHRALLLRGARSPSDVGELLHALCVSLAAVLNGQIELIEELEPGRQISPDHLLPVSQIVAEAIANAVKHGRAARAPGRVWVRSRAGRAGEVIIEVADDGPGLPDGMDPMADGGMGFRLIRALAAQAGGRVEFDSASSGLCCRLILSAAA